MQPDRGDDYSFLNVIADSVPAGITEYVFRTEPDDPELALFQLWARSPVPHSTLFSLSGFVDVVPVVILFRNGWTLGDTAAVIAPTARPRLRCAAPERSVHF